VIEHYRTIEEHKVIFIHNHDTAWHHPLGSVWKHIAVTVSAATFWTDNFGSVEFVMDNYFPPGSPRGAWFRNEDIVPWLFHGALMIEWVGKRWKMPCCGTFWLNSELMWQ
jgi:hypothetical protein